MRISVWDSAELQAVILGLRGFEREMRTQVRKQTRAVVGPAWTKAVTENAHHRTDVLVLAQTARVAASDQNVTLRSAQSTRALSGGLRPSANYGAFEFGANRTQKTTYTATSKRGKSFKVTRRTTAQLPTFTRSGRVVWPAAAEIIPRVASLWVQTVIRTFYEAVEKR